MFNIFTL